jgi:hypothetical protein
MSSLYESLQDGDHQRNEAERLEALANNTTYPQFQERAALRHEAAMHRAEIPQIARRPEER